MPRYLPDEVIAELNLPEPPPDADTALCVHHMERAPARPERMFIQFHGGVYRSDDAGSSWSEIGAGLPSDFGFPLVVDPADPDSAYVIPLVADMDRVMPEGRVRVYETRDGGETWAPRGDGLPQRHAYLTILRQAFQHKGWGRHSSSTSAQRPARCTAQATLGQRGSRSLRDSRPCTRCQSAESPTLIGSTG